jgi:uncharacterized protein (TIGR02246 family)
MTVSSTKLVNDAEQQLRALYQQVHEAWNARSAAAFAAPFAADGKTIGYDGSVHDGRDGIAAELEAVFKDHETARYVGVVKSVRTIGENAAVLHAIAGLVPPGSDKVNPDVNSHQTLTACRDDDGVWRIVLFQNTPAQFHGRPELLEDMTEQLQMALERR